MPLKLSDDTAPSKTTLLLENISFHNNEEGRYFKLSDSKGNGIRVEYIPQFISGWDHNRYEIALFENPYLTAENDIFEIYEANIEGRFGWICPITALDSNDNNYVEDKSFRHYRYVAYWKLLQSDYESRYLESKEEYRISDIFPNLCVCILSKEEIAKVPGFQIEQYALSFLLYDYLLFKTAISGKKVFEKESAIENLRKGGHAIRIRRSAFNISENQYTKSLFIEHLYQSENFLVKYIFLYQILEHFIQEIADKKLDELIQTYQDGTISKNTFREKISRFSNDRTLLKTAFENSIIKKETRVSFMDKCSFLFADIGEVSESNFEDVLYDLRNLITHRYRAIATKTEELKEIISLFEIIIIELLITYNTKTKEIQAVEEEVKPEILLPISTETIDSPQNRNLSFKETLINIWNRIIRALTIRR